MVRRGGGWQNFRSLGKGFAPSTYVSPNMRSIEMRAAAAAFLSYVEGLVPCWVLSGVY